MLLWFDMREGNYSVWNPDRWVWKKPAILAGRIGSIVFGGLLDGAAVAAVEYALRGPRSPAVPASA